MFENNSESERKVDYREGGPIMSNVVFLRPILLERNMSVVDLIDE